MFHMNHKNTLHRIRKAFTIVEILVVLSILTILSTISISSYTGSMANSRDTARKSDLQNVFANMKTVMKAKGSYPVPGKAFDLNI